MLKHTFGELLNKFTGNGEITKGLWIEIEKAYSETSRHYHTLSHLQTMLSELFEIKDEIQNWDTILFSLFYHDVIYNPLRQDNEKRSAELAVKRMKSANVPDIIIKNCKQQILATKTHKPGADNDTNYFTDADLAILGKNRDAYITYFQNVRKEFSAFPDIIYKTGRKKVLRKFLERENIFKTDFFYKKYEQQARENLQYELEWLS